MAQESGQQVTIGSIQQRKKMTETKDVFATLNPTYVGSWCIGGNCFINVTKKPTDVQIKNTEEMFGWKWKESEK
jgi:hypothetical protein